MGRIGACALLLGGTLTGWGQSSSLPPGTTAPDASQAVQAENPLNEAEAKLAAKDYTTARTMLLAYVSAHPRNARALFDLGYLEDATGQLDAAISEYRRAIGADPSQFEARAALGLLLAGQGKTEGAVEQLSAAAKLTPTPPNPPAQAQANRALARLLEPTDVEGARKALIATLGESPETPADTLLAGQIATKAGNADAAADAYGKVLAKAPEGSPEQSEASAGLAHLLIASKQYPKAEAVLRRALASSPKNVVLNTELANVLGAEGKQKEALPVLETLHAAQPDDENIGAMLADLYTQTGDPGKADTLYQKLIATHPHDPVLLAGRGDSLVREQKDAEAIAVLQEATRLNPQNGDAWSSLAFAASQAHQPQLVLDALAMRSKVMPETPATYFLAATACDTLHETKRAVELYRRFLSVAGSSFPDEVWQARHRLRALAK